MLMMIKNILRRFGLDVVRYRPYYELVLQPRNIRTVIDIGANIGDFSHDMRERLPDAHIYAFEPLADCFAQLTERMQGDSKFCAWQTALGDSTGETTIQRSSFNPSSSLLPMSELHKQIYPKSSGSTQESIKIARLDDILADVSLEKPIFIKMDVQGYEGQVIAGGKTTIGLADIVQIETSFVPLYQGQPLFDDISAQMRALGFAYRGEVARHYDKDGTLIYQDSIFEQAVL